MSVFRNRMVKKKKLKVSCTWIISCRGSLSARLLFSLNLFQNNVILNKRSVFYQITNFKLGIPLTEALAKLKQYLIFIFILINTFTAKGFFWN